MLTLRDGQRSGFLSTAVSGEVCKAARRTQVGTSSAAATSQKSATRIDKSGRNSCAPRGQRGRGRRRPGTTAGSRGVLAENAIWSGKANEGCVNLRRWRRTTHLTVAALVAGSARACSSICDRECRRSARCRRRRWLKRFAFNLNQIEGKPGHSRHSACCVLHLIRYTASNAKRFDVTEVRLSIRTKVTPKPP